MFRLYRVTSIAGLIVAGALGAIVATAIGVYAHGGDTTRIHSCVRSDGTLRVVSATATCKPPETALDWSIAGPAGLQGLQGAQGQQGVPGQPGAQGLPGAQGQPGVPGQPGTQGVPGQQGQPGQQGLPGVKGDTGSQGLQGVKGDMGLQGPAGSGSGLTSIEELAGLPCRLGTIYAGSIIVTYINYEAHLQCLGGTVFPLALSLSGADANAGIDDNTSGTGVCRTGWTPGQCTHPYPSGNSVTLHAVDQGSDHLAFDHWEGACTGTSPTCSVMMDQARSVTAVFAAADAVTVQIVDPGHSSFCISAFGCNGGVNHVYGFGGGVTWNGNSCSSAGGTPAANGTVTTTCMFNVIHGRTNQLFQASSSTMFFSGLQTGIAFASWSGACSGTNPDCTVGSITGDITIVATFVETTS